MFIKNKIFYKIVSLVISLIALISIFPFTSVALNNEIYHSSVFENRDIKVRIYSDRIKITFPENTSKYLIKVGTKGILNVNAGKTVKISSDDLPVGKYNLRFLISNGVYDTYTECGFFGPISVYNGKILYNKSSVLNKNLDIISRLSAITADERQQMLKPTENMQSDDASIISKSEELVKGLNTDLEKIEAVYKFLVNNIYYDYDYLNGLKSRPADDAVSVLKTKTAVCDGYASLMVAMLKYLGIPSLKAVGYAESPFNAKYNLKNGITDHAWVVSYINGKWLSFDPTFDCSNGVSFGIRDGKERDSQVWEYFGVDIRQLSSYRRFDGYISEITPENIRIVASKNNFKLGINETEFIRFNIEPVWASGNGNWKLRKYTSSGWTDVKLQTLGNAAILSVKGKKCGKVYLEISAENVPYSVGCDFTVYDKTEELKKLNDNKQNKQNKQKSVDMYRLYNPLNKEHFYTSDKNERNTLKNKYGWVYEGIGWIAPSASKNPVYRLYSSITRDHHYTMDKNERDTLVRVHGYTYEGIGWYSDDAKGVPLYRQYAPFLISGAHNYTTDKNEKKVLVKERGWIDEGIGWYGIKQ